MFVFDFWVRSGLPMLRIITQFVHRVGQPFLLWRLRRYSPVRWCGLW